MSGNTVDINTQRAKSGLWYSEDLAPGVTISLLLKRILVSTYSSYQKIDIVETVYGKTLVTDGKTQSAQIDEFSYHESLVHPAMILSALLCVDNVNKRNIKRFIPKTVFIGGGGELATAREVLRHKTIERVVMVDLDEQVIKVCKEHLPEWGGDMITDDPRLELIIGDAYEYLINSQEVFDVIIMDISDPIEAGPGVMLYTKEFYEHVKTLLNASHGVFVTQAGIAEAIPLCYQTTTVPHKDKKSSGILNNVGLGNQEDEICISRAEKNTSCFGPIINTLKAVFDRTIPYSTNVPSFGSDWGFVLAYSDSFEAVVKRKKEIDFANVPVNLVDDTLKALIYEDVYKEQDFDNEELKFYDGTTHRRMFALPKPLRTALRADERVMTRDNPVFMY